LHQYAHLFTNSMTMMQTYYSTLEAIAQQTQQLDGVACRHCGKREQLVSHGFIYKKQAVASNPVSVGKRVLCSQRFGRTGCGRTVQLYLASVVRYLHAAGPALANFIGHLLAGLAIAKAYQQATGATESRQSYRWFNRMFLRLSDYRSQSHRAPVPSESGPCKAHGSLRRHLLTTTLEHLLRHFQAPLCATYQQQLQTSFW